MAASLNNPHCFYLPTSVFGLDSPSPLTIPPLYFIDVTRLSRISRYETVALLMSFRALSQGISVLGIPPYILVNYDEHTRRFGLVGVDPCAGPCHGPRMVIPIFRTHDPVSRPASQARFLSGFHQPASSAGPISGPYQRVPRSASSARFGQTTPHCPSPQRYL